MASTGLLATASLGSGSHRGLKVSKAPGTNSMMNRALNHLPQRAVSLLAQIFNEVLIHNLPTVLKHARVISILKLVKDPALTSSYRPNSFLDTIGKLSEKILHFVDLHHVMILGK